MIEALIKYNEKNTQKKQIILFDHNKNIPYFSEMNVECQETAGKYYTNKSK